MLLWAPDFHSSFGTVQVCYVSNDMGKSSVNKNGSNNPTNYKDVGHFLTT